MPESQEPDQFTSRRGALDFLAGQPYDPIFILHGYNEVLDKREIGLDEAIKIVTRFGVAHANADDGLDYIEHDDRLPIIAGLFVDRGHFQGINGLTFALLNLNKIAHDAQRTFRDQRFHTGGDGHGYSSAGNRFIFLFHQAKQVAHRSVGALLTKSN